MNLNCSTVYLSVLVKEKSCHRKCCVPKSMLVRVFPGIVVNPLIIDILFDVEISLANYLPFVTAVRFLRCWDDCNDESLTRKIT